MAEETNEIDRYVGGRVRQLRNSRGVTQRQLANAIGVTYQQLQKYESGVNRIGAGRLYRIAEALGAPLGYFFQGVEATTSSAALPEDTPNLSLVLGGVIPDPVARRAFVALCQAVAESAARH